MVRPSAKARLWAALKVRCVDRLAAFLVVLFVALRAAFFATGMCILVSSDHEQETSYRPERLRVVMIDTTFD
jgi:hypothetical protein